MNQNHGAGFITYRMVSKSRSVIIVSLNSYVLPAGYTRTILSFNLIPDIPIYSVWVIHVQGFIHVHVYYSREPTVGDLLNLPKLGPQIWL